MPDSGRRKLNGRIKLLAEVQRQQRALDRAADGFDGQRQQAVSVLTDATVSGAFDVENADPRLLERYGANEFGLSLLMAKRLVEGGVNLVQVNMGKASSWDTHIRNFVNLKDNLLPPLDRCVSALLDDLTDSGLIDETLVVMTGEFGRSPKINKTAGRDHWRAVNTMLFSGGGVQGSNIIGASDRIGAEPTGDVQTPENFAATIYDALGVSRDATWTDVDGRPYNIYMANPIEGIYA